MNHLHWWWYHRAHIASEEWEYWGTSFTFENYSWKYDGI